MITIVARKKKVIERQIMRWWVTIAVTVKVGGCAAEHGVLVRRQRRHWTRSFRGSEGADGLSSVPHRVERTPSSP